MTNKTRLQEGAIFLALVIWTMCVIATCAGLWNAATEIKVGGFYIATSIATLIINLAAIFFCGKKTYEKYGKLSIEESQKKIK